MRDDFPVFVEFLRGPLDGDTRESPSPDAVPSVITHTTVRKTVALYTPFSGALDTVLRRRVVTYLHIHTLTAEEAAECFTPLP